MRILALSIALLVSTPVAARPAVLPPIDECSKDADFAGFLGELKRVTAARNRDAFLALLADDVTVDFGGGSGRDAFARAWSFDPGEYGNLWQWLDRILGMGCARTNGVRVIPSLIEQADPDDEAVLDMRLVLPGAKLFREPNNIATTSAVPPWTVVTATNSGGDLWTGVQLPDGRKGWISDDALYEPLGYRMTIEKRGTQWMVTAFVAGD